MKCPNESIRMEILEEHILNEINKQVTNYYDKSKVEKNYYEKKVNSNYEEQINTLKEEKLKLSKKVNDIESRFNLLYEDCANGVITVESFVGLKGSYAKEKEDCNTRKIVIDNDIVDLQVRWNRELSEKKIFKRYKNVKNLDRLLVEIFIEKIYIDQVDFEEKRNIEIIWNLNSY